MNGTRKTALWDSMGEALSLFGPLTPGDTLYVISDGHDTASRLQPKDMEQYASTLRVFALIPDSPGEDAFPIPEILQQAVRSGGLALVVSRERQPDMTSNLGPAWGRVSATAGRITEQETRQFQRIGSFYAVAAELPQPLDKPNEWKLKVTPGKESGHHHLNVIYPTQLGPCEATRALAKGAP